jgi:hypothetical protein
LIAQDPVADEGERFVARHCPERAGHLVPDEQAGKMVVRGSGTRWRLRAT